MTGLAAGWSPQMLPRHSGRLTGNSEGTLSPTSENAEDKKLMRHSPTSERLPVLAEDSLSGGMRMRSLPRSYTILHCSLLVGGDVLADALPVGQVPGLIRSLHRRSQAKPVIRLHVVAPPDT